MSRSPSRLMAALFAAGLLPTLVLLPVPISTPIVWALVGLDIGFLLLLLFGLAVSFAKSRFTLFLESQKREQETQQRKIQLLLQTSIKEMEFRMHRKWLSDLKEMETRLQEDKRNKPLSSSTDIGNQEQYKQLIKNLTSTL